jgi:hypothetical protein
MNRAGLEAAVEQNRVDRSASYIALSALENAIEAPGPGREKAWLDTVLDALDAFIDALDEQARHNREPESLLSQIAEDQPRFEYQIKALEDELEALAAAEQSVRNQVDEQSGQSRIDVAEIRARLAALDSDYRIHRARETDLVYEATNVDIGGRG